MKWAGTFVNQKDLLWEYRKVQRSMSVWEPYVDYKGGFLGPMCDLSILGQPTLEASEGHFSIEFYLVAHKLMGKDVSKNEEIYTGMQFHILEIYLAVWGYKITSPIIYQISSTTSIRIFLLMEDITDLL